MVDSGTNGRAETLVDVEKGPDFVTDEPELLENLITPEETEHQELHAASKPLILTEKILVSLLVVCFVMVEAYFVGVSVRDWFDQEHTQNSTNIVLENCELVMSSQLHVPEVFVDGFKRGHTPEPFQYFARGLNLGQTSEVFKTVTEQSPNNESEDIASPQFAAPTKMTRRNSPNCAD